MKGRQQGDTIVEVLFAVAVFSLVAVGSMSIMNQGIATAQRALEITLVRQQMDAQADAIRYIHQAYLSNRQASAPAAKEWRSMTSDHAEVGASSLTSVGSSMCPTIPNKAFILNTHAASVANVSPASFSIDDSAALPPAYSQVRYDPDDVGNPGDPADDTIGSVKDAYGIWVEAVPTSKNAPSAKGRDGKIGIGYTDFHIRACWDSPGSGSAMTLGTIVRLYEPAV